MKRDFEVKKTRNSSEIRSTANVCVLVSMVSSQMNFIFVAIVVALIILKLSILFARIAHVISNMRHGPEYWILNE